MKNNFVFIAGISCFSSCAVIAGVEDAFNLEIKHQGSSKTLDFTGEQYATFVKSPDKLPTALKQKGVECCAPQTKVSETVWQCCDKTTIIVAPNRRASILLDAAFKAEKPDPR